MELWSLPPAMTLLASRYSIELDIDLVPCFVFGAQKWPTNGFIRNPIANRPEFFIVPKEPKGLSDTDRTIICRYWRLSFQEQERELMNGKERLKPTIRLFKKLRCTCGHNTLASYYIKTVVLHVALAENPDFWNNSLSYTFMYVFQKYLAYLKKKNIPYYWNKNNNLINGAKSERLVQIHSELKKIYDDIERNLNDPSVLLCYILNEPSEEEPKEEPRNDPREEPINNNADNNMTTIIVVTGLAGLLTAGIMVASKTLRARRDSRRD